VAVQGIVLLDARDVEYDTFVLARTTNSEHPKNDSDVDDVLHRRDFTICEGTELTPRKQKIHLTAVRACLDMVCTKCGYLIPPAEIRRIDFETVRCPACGEKFVPSRKGTK
jgi:hypothetical protein